MLDVRAETFGAEVAEGTKAKGRFKVNHHVEVYDPEFLKEKLNGQQITRSQRQY